MEQKSNFTLRLSDSEKSVLTEKAKASGMAIAEYIRFKLFEANKPDMLTKYEGDLMRCGINNTLLLSHIIDSLGKKELIADAKNMADKWIANNYKVGAE